ncbi:unnamed protein product, partial [marine sediment metagenome]
DKPRLRKIVDELVERGIPKRIAFQGFCRSNIVHEEDILLFKKLNYRFVRFGAETGSERLLRRIKGEGISVADHQRVIDLCAKHGLRCAASFMFGIPGETRKDLKLTIDFLRRNKGKCQIRGFYLFNPMPGTALWEEMTRDGLVTEDLPFERLQLDLLKPNFSWDGLLYFNGKNVPLKRFRKIIERIRKEFVDPYPPGEEADWLSGSGEHRFRGSELYVLSEAYRQGEHIVYSDALREKMGVGSPIAAFGPYCNLRRGEYELELEMDLPPSEPSPARPDIVISLAAGKDGRRIRRYLLSELERDDNRYRTRFVLETDEKLFQVIVTPQPGCAVTLCSLALRKIEGS